MSEMAVMRTISILAEKAMEGRQLEIKQGEIGRAHV